LSKNADIAVSFLKSVVEEKAELLKNQEENKGLISLKPHKVKRLYVDGCFDLMHSGHFNAIRQVCLY
jgi:ethanolamine-phosphate cytidylyltransferase